MSLLRRGLRYFSLLSLLFWSGVAFYVVQHQPHEAPPAGYPATVDACRRDWAGHLSTEFAKEATEEACDAFYVALGDRNTSWLARLKERTVQRVADNTVAEYLRLHPPQPGAQIDGQNVINTMGAARISQLLYQAIATPEAPLPLKRKAFLRCILDGSRRVTSPDAISNLPAMCMRL